MFFLPQDLVAHLLRENSAGSLNGMFASLAESQTPGLQSARHSLAKDDDGTRRASLVMR